MNEKLKTIKNKGKELFNRIFIDGLTGMAWGLFSTLIIGLIIEQIGKITTELLADEEVENYYIMEEYENERKKENNK